MSTEPKVSNATWVFLRRDYLENGDVQCSDVIEYLRETLGRLEAAEARIAKLNNLIECVDEAKQREYLLLEPENAELRRILRERIERSEKYRDELEQLRAKVAEMEANHGPDKCAKMLPPRVRPDFVIDPEDF